jgi:hypothetical protein
MRSDTVRNSALPMDTTLEAARVQIAGWQKLGMQQKLEIASQMYQAARQTAVAEVQRRHPHYTEREAQLVVTRRVLGEKLFNAAFPNVHLEP